MYKFKIKSVCYVIYKLLHQLPTNIDQVGFVNRLISFILSELKLLIAARVIGYLIVLFTTFTSQRINGFSSTFKNLHCESQG